MELDVAQQFLSDLVGANDHTFGYGAKESLPVGFRGHLKITINNVHSSASASKG